MANFTITESAASARALLATSPSASIEATASGRELATEWLKITAVPLLVFLIGACLWSCIKKSSAWRILIDDGGSARTEAADSSRPIDSNHAVLALEAGLELRLSQGRGRAEDLSVDSSKRSATKAPITCGITSENGDVRHC